MTSLCLRNPLNQPLTEVAEHRRAVSPKHVSAKLQRKIHEGPSWRLKPQLQIGLWSQAESEPPSAVAAQAALSVSDSLSSSDVRSSPRSSMGVSSSDGDDDAEGGSAAPGE
jgi:hypothetical protein